MMTFRTKSQCLPTWVLLIGFVYKPNIFCNYNNTTHQFLWLFAGLPTVPLGTFVPDHPNIRRDEIFSVFIFVFIFRDFFQKFGTELFFLFNLLRGDGK